MDQLENQQIKLEDNPVHIDTGHDPINRKANGSRVSKFIVRILRNNQSLPDDTFTLMMVSGPCIASWVVGISCFSVQITLCSLIMLGFENDGNFFDVPWRQDVKNYVGQFLSLFIAVLTQNDVLSSIQVFVWCHKNPQWDIFFFGMDEDSDFPSTWEWLLQIAIPNTMKLLQGIFALFISFMIIIQSDSIINLFKILAALTVVSQLNNIVFDLSAYGYFGRSLQLMAARVNDLEIDASEARQWRGFKVQVMTLCILIVSMVTGWAVVVNSQIHGDFFRINFPDCDETFEVAEFFFEMVTVMEVL